MAYTERIKSFDRIRTYMREFYVYGFKHRGEYDEKSARSYDDERRRIESYLGDYMGFRQTTDGKQFFLSIDSRSIPQNPLYRALKAKSCTDGDLTLHFLLLDILADGALSIRTLMERIDDHMCHFPNAPTFDESTVRKKLKEYVQLGICIAEPEGRTMRYRRSEVHCPEAWRDAIAFFSEAGMLGVVGSFMLDTLPEAHNIFAFKHHYITHATESEVLCTLFEAISAHRRVQFYNVTRHHCAPVPHVVVPLMIFMGVQNGRQHLLAYDPRRRNFTSFRLDHMRHPELLEIESEFPALRERLEHLRPHMWGVMCSAHARPQRVVFDITFQSNEQHIPRRLARERRCGTVKKLNNHTCRFEATIFDSNEIAPWIRTFIGRITYLEMDNHTVKHRILSDIETLYNIYGLRSSPISENPSSPIRSVNIAPRRHHAHRAPISGGHSTLFHEIYSLYYLAVARILTAASQKTLDTPTLRRICSETAFPESNLTIEPALCTGRWPFLSPDGTTPLRHYPVRPLTTLERRWRKAIALDSRFRIFGDLTDDDDDATPLFTPDDYVLYDRYSDGDPYSSPAYVKNFRTVLEALHSQRMLDITYLSGQGRLLSLRCLPYKLEYSEKDDKFRLCTYGAASSFINLSRIVRCTLLDIQTTLPPTPERHKCTCVLELFDTRNALERALLHFAHLEKQTERIDSRRYRMILYYDPGDESELLIRVLSFGPMLKALAPDGFVEKIRQRLQRQLDCGLDTRLK